MELYNRSYFEDVADTFGGIFFFALTILKMDLNDLLEKLYSYRAYKALIYEGIPLNIISRSSIEHLYEMNITDKKLDYEYLSYDYNYQLGMSLAYLSYYYIRPFDEILKIISAEEIINLLAFSDGYGPMYVVLELRDKLEVNMLKYYRKKKKISQEKLAEISRVSIRNIRNYEQNTSALYKASIENVVRLSKVLHVKVEELITFMHFI